MRPRERRLPRFSRAMVCKEGVGGGPREAIPGGIMGGRRACVLTKCAAGTYSSFRVQIEIHSFSFCENSKTLVCVLRGSGWSCAETDWRVWREAAEAQP